MSAENYVIRDNEGYYFVTFTVIDWVDVFTRKTYKHELVNSLNYCVKDKNLNIHAWVIMSNHMHLIISGRNEVYLPGVIRDYKKFTSKKIYERLGDSEESRSVWMKKKFEFAANRTRRNQDFKIWKDGYYAIPLDTLDQLKIKVDYIHANPVRSEIVYHPEHFLYSSARDYAGEKGLVDIELLY
jgi:REP element-mobilizing transposase RayT